MRPVSLLPSAHQGITETHGKVGVFLRFVATGVACGIKSFSMQQCCLLLPKKRRRNVPGLAEKNDEDFISHPTRDGMNTYCVEGAKNMFLGKRIPSILEVT